MEKLLWSVKNLHDSKERGRIIRQAQAHKTRILNRFAKIAQFLDLDVICLRVSVLFETILAQLNSIQCT